MKSRAFTGVLLLVFLCAACLVVGPALSGEHPWGSDKDGDDDKPGDIFYTGDTIVPVYDTIIVTEVVPSTTVTSSLSWFVVFTSVVSTVSMSL